MAETLAVTIGNDLVELERLAAQAAAFLEAQDAPPKVAYAVSLALEELVTNTIKYGYDDAGRHEIEVKLQIEPARVTLSLADDGHPFDPLAAPPPDVAAPLEERSVGGLGLHLIRQMAAAASYRREGGKNLLELRFA